MSPLDPSARISGLSLPPLIVYGSRTGRRVAVEGSEEKTGPGGHVARFFASRSEGEDSRSPSGRAPRVRGAGSDWGDHPCGNQHEMGAHSAVGN